MELRYCQHIALVAGNKFKQNRQIIKEINTGNEEAEVSLLRNNMINYVVNAKEATHKSYWKKI